MRAWHELISHGIDLAQPIVWSYLAAATRDLSELFAEANGGLARWSVLLSLARARSALEWGHAAHTSGSMVL